MDYDPFDASEPEFEEPDFLAPTTRSAPAGQGHEVAAIRAELEKRKRSLLATALDEAQLRYEADTLTATFASENAFTRRVRESAPLFREIGEQLFGRPIKINVRVSGEAAPSAADEARQARVKLKEEAMQNPVVRAIVEKFRGEVIDVHPAAAQP